MKILKFLLVLVLSFLIVSCSSVPKDTFVGPVPLEPTFIRTRLVVHYKDKQPIVDLSEIDKWFGVCTASLQELKINFKIVDFVFLEYEDSTDFEDIALDSDKTPDILSIYVMEETETQRKNKLFENMAGMAPMGQYATIKAANYILLMPCRRGFDNWVFVHEVGHVLGDLEHTFKIDQTTGEMVGDVDCPDLKATANPLYCNIMNYAAGCKFREFTPDQLQKIWKSLHKYQSDKIINYVNY